MGSMTDPTRIRLTIDRLRLFGVTHGDSGTLRRALTAALEARLGGADSIAASSREHLSLTIEPANGPAALGNAAGVAIGTQLTRTKR